MTKKETEQNQTIIQKENPLLRETAKQVNVAEIRSRKISTIIRRMQKALEAEEDGIAIAAPQIGYLLRIFVVSGKIFAKDFMKNKTEEKIPFSPSVEEKTHQDLILINPKISKLSREKEWVMEGCLSVRPLYGKTFRSKKTVITAYDKNGQKFTRGASGLLAQIFQHETDHLNGILFIDHAKEIRAERLDTK